MWTLNRKRYAPDASEQQTSSSSILPWLCTYTEKKWYIKKPKFRKNENWIHLWFTFQVSSTCQRHSATRSNSLSCECQVKMKCCTDVNRRDTHCPNTFAQRHDEGLESDSHLLRDKSVLKRRTDSCHWMIFAWQCCHGFMFHAISIEGITVHDWDWLICLTKRCHLSCDSMPLTPSMCICRPILSAWARGTCATTAT